MHKKRIGFRFCLWQDIKGFDMSEIRELISIYLDRAIVVGFGHIYKLVQGPKGLISKNRGRCWRRNLDITGFRKPENSDLYLEKYLHFQLANTGMFFNQVKVPFSILLTE